MARVKRGVVAGRRHKKILGKAKGYYNARRKVFRAAKQAVIKAGQYAYKGRKIKKRDYRSLWIQRLNAAARMHGLSYSRFIAGLKAIDLGLDRKALADLAVNEPQAFAVIVEQIKAAVPAGKAAAATCGAAAGSAAAFACRERSRHAACAFRGCRSWTSRTWWPAASPRSPASRTATRSRRCACACSARRARSPRS